MVVVARLTIYPIKSLDAHDVAAARVTSAGPLAGDRRWAMVNRAGSVINAKRTARVHSLRCRFLESATVVTLRAAGKEASFSLLSQRDLAETWLSDFLGESVRLIENTVQGFPDDTLAAGPTVVSTATLVEVASWFDGLSADDVRRRIRANLEVGECEAFWEDRLIGRRGQPVRFRVGDVCLSGIQPCQRCVVPTRDASTGEVWRGFARIFAQRRAETLPSWTPVEAFDHFYCLSTNTAAAPTAHARGTIRQGDRVEFAP